MALSQKTQYAFRSVFELARRYGQGPTKAAEIAEAQDIPVRFLEAILNQLKKGGFVESMRGKEGGYLLARAPRELVVGEILRFMEGPLTPVACMEENPAQDCSLRDACVLADMWKRAHEAMMAVYDQTSFQDLLDESKARIEAGVLTYSI